MGASRMSAICAELEAVGRFGDLGGAAALAGRLEAEWGRVREALEEETQGSRG